LIERLLRDGKPPAPPPPAPPRPQMSLDLEGISGNSLAANPQAEILAHEKTLTLRLTVENYPGDKVADWIESVQWQIDDHTPAPFHHEGSVAWSADLSRRPWQRGLHKIHAVVRTRGLDSGEYVEDLDVRYLPPPPSVEVKSPESDGKVTSAKTEFQAGIRALEPNLGASVELIWTALDTGKSQTWKLRLPADQSLLNLQQPLELAPGFNRIVLRATNDGAAKDPSLAGLETTEVQRMLYLAAAPSKPESRIVVHRIISPEEPDGGKSEVLNAGQRLAVDVPRVRLTAGFEASQGMLETVDLPLAASTMETSPRFEAGKHKNWTVTADYALNPGPNQLVFRARAQDGATRSQEYEVNYRPRLPELKIVQPEDQAALYHGKDPDHLQLEARILWPDNRLSCEAILLVNDRLQGVPVKVEAEMAILAIPVALGAGDNRLQLRLRNAWGSERAFDPIHVRYLRPPMVTTEPAPAVSDRGRVDLEAQAVSAAALKSIELEINGKASHVASEFRLLAKDKGLWHVRLHEVPLAGTGLNQIRLWVTNAEPSRSLKPGLWSIEYRPSPRERLPQIADLDLPPKTSEAVIKVSFHITSASNLSRVELVHQTEGRLTRRQRLNVGELTTLRPDYFEGQTEIALESGANQVGVEAENAAGIGSSASSLLSYLPVPARLVLEELQPMGSSGRPHGEAIPVTDNDLSRITPMTGGQILLRGRVQTLRPGDEQLRLEGGIWIYVNGLRQLLSHTLDQ